MFNFGSIRALIIDIDGTLFHGDQPLPGLPHLFAFLRRRGISAVVATNNTTQTPAQYRRKLALAGAKISQEQVITAGVATAAYLKRELPAGASLYLIGEAALRQVIRRAGFELMADAGHPAAAVVVGGDTRLTYAKLKYAALHLQRGARLVGANPDLLIPTVEGLLPEAGVTLAALQAATGITPTVVGKPERLLFELALAKLGSAAAHTAILGDRLETDILGAQRAGLKTILVTTGVDNAATAAAKGITPDVIVGGLKELVELWSAKAT